MFSYLLEKKDRTYNSVNDSEIFTLEMKGARISWDELTYVGYLVSEDAKEKLCQDIEKFRNAYALLTSDYFPFSKIQCAVFKGTDRAVFLDKSRSKAGDKTKKIRNLEEMK